MRLSEAIRLGSMIRPKAKGYLFTGGRSCALGAALEATGTPYEETVIMLLGGEVARLVANRAALYERLRTQWPWLGNSCVGLTFMERIYQLNDSGMTREQVAEWVEGVEPLEVEVPAATTEVCHAGKA